ncbi:MAG TPA: Gfo/Idh/MocA family oxidoreductase [Xanthomonadaceae bacterium]|nr:Gfo/Idh/MocA family oxidoreductase [Xanthomonadaceae bacterium]
MSRFNSRRRSVLSGLAMGAASVAASRAVHAQDTAEFQPAGARRFGIAVVGLGNYARFAIERLANARLARPAGIVTGSPERAREIATRLDIPVDAIYGYDDYERLAGDERIDAVHICLPVGMHAAHSLRAMASGKHILVEKPLAATVADARAMADAATQGGRVLMPAYRAWYSAALQEAMRRTREGTHGNLVSIDAHKGFAMSLPAGNWRFDPAQSGGGCLLDIGIYSVQLQRWIAGSMPRRVHAIAHSAAGDARYERVESDISWLAEFDNGVTATGSASWRYRLQNRARVGYADAWLDLDPATPAIGERLRLGLDAPNRVEELMLPLRDQLPLMYDDFAEACLGRKPVAVPAAEGIDDLRMIEAILQAASRGRSVQLEV